MLPPSLGIVFPQTVGNAGQKGRVDHLYPGIGLDRFLDALSRLSAGRLALPAIVRSIPSSREGTLRSIGTRGLIRLGAADIEWDVSVALGRFSVECRQSSERRLVAAEQDSASRLGKAGDTASFEAVKKLPSG